MYLREALKKPTTIRELCDILIIGGGVAGCYAAAKAKEADQDLDIILMEKAAIKRSGAACRGMDAINVVVIPTFSTTEEYVESVRINSMGVFDEAVTRRIADESFEAMRQLEEWGVDFPRGENGRYIVSSFHPKGRFSVEMRGDNFKPLLAEKAVASGARIMERTMAARLLTEGDRVTGAIGYNIRTGKITAIAAKAVILACGGANRVGLPSTGYLHGTFNCPYSAGDGFSMALRAGADLVNFEFTSTSAMTKGYNGPGLSTFIRHGGILVNALGEPIMAKYAPELKEKAPSGIRWLAAWTETKEGRGPIYFRLSHLPEEKIRLIEEGIFTVERPTTHDYFKSKGIDMRKDDVEVTLTETYLEGGHAMSGVKINDRGETNIKGLYAAGDVAANPFGFLTAALVYGAATARNAIAYIADAKEPSIDEEAVAEEAAKIAAMKTGEIDPRQFEYKTRRVVNEYVQPPKSERRLRYALDYIKKLRADEPKLRAEDPHTTMKAIEARFILDSVEMTTRASLERRESRWGLMHMRVDYPKRDDANWLKQVVVRLNDEGVITVETRPLGGD
jgi:succinate dehydrogenase/fumarate reductase flavoprotein subunit